MSTVRPTPEQGNHGRSRASHISKSQRVLACVLCQQRKIGCDRKFPCSNCTKNQKQCVPATQVRPRRRRFPERELLDRLRTYEDLLHQNRIKFEPLYKDSAVRVKEPFGDSYDSGNEQPEARKQECSSPSTTASKSGSAYEAKYAISLLISFYYSRIFSEFFSMTY